MAQKLTALKSKLSTAPNRLRILPNINPSATPRQRGRGWMERRERWLRLHPLCAHCQAADLVTAAQQVDHRIPLHQGGADDESNFDSICIPCHKAKTAAEAAQRSAHPGGWHDATVPAIAAPAPFWQGGVPSDGNGGVRS